MKKLTKDDFTLIEREPEWTIPWFYEWKSGDLIIHILPCGEGFDVKASREPKQDFSKIIPMPPEPLEKKCTHLNGYTHRYFDERNEDALWEKALEIANALKEKYNHYV